MNVKYTEKMVELIRQSKSDKQAQQEILSECGEMIGLWAIIKKRQRLGLKRGVGHLK